jgi:hypothetical protein
MAVSVLNTSGGTIGSGQATLQWSHTLHADADYALVGVRNSDNAGVVPSSVTIGGAPMQLAFEYQNPGTTADRYYVYWIPAEDLPAPGARTVIVTWASNTTDGVAGVSVCASGVAQEAPVGIVQANAMGVTDIDTSITTTTPDERIIQMLLLRTAVSVTPDSGQSTIYTGRAHTLTRVGPSTPGPQAMDVTLSGASSLGLSVLVPLLAADEGGGEEIPAEQAFAGVGAFAAGATVRRAASVSTVGAATFGATAAVRRAGQLDVVAAATFASEASVRRAAELGLGAIATFAAGASVRRAAQLDVTAIATLEVIASARRTASVGFVGAAVFVPAVSGAGVRASVAFVGSSALSASAHLAIAATVNLAGAGTLSVTTFSRRAAHVAFAGSATFRARVRTQALAQDLPAPVVSVVPARAYASLVAIPATATCEPARAPAYHLE